MWGRREAVIFSPAGAAGPSWGMWTIGMVCRPHALQQRGDPPSLKLRWTSPPLCLQLNKCPSIAIEKLAKWFAEWDGFAGAASKVPLDELGVTFGVGERVSNWVGRSAQMGRLRRVGELWVGKRAGKCIRFSGRGGLGERAPQRSPAR